MITPWCVKQDYCSRTCIITKIISVNMVGLSLGEQRTSHARTQKGREETNYLTCAQCCHHRTLVLLLVGTLNWVKKLLSSHSAYTILNPASNIWQQPKLANLKFDTSLQLLFYILTYSIHLQFRCHIQFNLNIKFKVVQQLLYVSVAANCCSLQSCIIDTRWFIRQFKTLLPVRFWPF